MCLDLSCIAGIPGLPSSIFYLSFYNDLDSVHNWKERIFSLEQNKGDKWLFLKI